MSESKNSNCTEKKKDDTKKEKVREVNFYSGTPIGVRLISPDEDFIWD